jgi:hypothetical protein
MSEWRYMFDSEIEWQVAYLEYCWLLDSARYCYPSLATTMTQSKARLIYPDIDFDGVCEICDYSPIIKSFGDVVVQIDEEDYQGDSFVLLRKDEQYGFLCFGWGSCSGCDALQGCETVEALDELIDELQDSIKWFDSLPDAKAYIADDLLRRGSFYYHVEAWDKFKTKVMEVAE